MVAEAGGPSTRGHPGRSDRLPWHPDHGQSGAMGWIHSITSCRNSFALFQDGWVLSCVGASDCSLFQVCSPFRHLTRSGRLGKH
eukprot:10026156-Alexandrium_andersonii.AAC.1